MSQHPSLRIDSVGAKHRNVLKRFEKVKKLQADGKWDSDANSAYRLPKVKSIKIKVKSSGGKEEKAADAAAAPEAGKAAAAAKPAATVAAKPKK